MEYKKPNEGYSGIGSGLAKKLWVAATGLVMLATSTVMPSSAAPREKQEYMLQLEHLLQQPGVIYLIANPLLYMTPAGDKPPKPAYKVKKEEKPKNPRHKNGHRNKKDQEPPVPPLFPIVDGSGK